MHYVCERPLVRTYDPCKGCQCKWRNKFLYKQQLSWSRFYSLSFTLIMAPPRHICEQHEFIKKVKQSSPKSRQRYISEASPEQIRSLCECVHNVFRGRLPVSSKTIKRLRPHATEIKRIAHPRGGAENKRNLLIQHGGFLPILLGAVLPVLAQIVSSLAE